MRYKLLAFFFFSLGSLACQAQVITQQMALQKAKHFMEKIGMPSTNGISRAPSSLHTSETAPYYVFNASSGQGFVIVSGDERTDEILGYGTEGQFDEKHLPENMKSWLKGYADQIKSLQEGKLMATPAHVQSHAVVNNMIKTMWDQGNPYNQQCPIINGSRCVTGCVATAMAMVMKYSQWPQAPTAEIPAYYSNETLGNLEALPALAFEWDKMQNQYNQGQTQQQCQAVAQLMRYCGQAVGMNYGPNGSSSNPWNVAKALTTYFGYDSNTRCVQRINYSVEGWDNLIYGEIKNARPVVYSGHTSNSGHTFVCDGYDGHGYYHINWGWGGYLNGYFKLSILNPYGGGVGGTSNSGFNMNHSAIVGIQKPTFSHEDMRELTLGDGSLSIENKFIVAWFFNCTSMTCTAEYGFICHSMGDGNDVNYHVSRTMESGVGLKYSLDTDGLSLSDGVYRFYPYYILQGSGQQHVLCEYKVYCEVVMRGGHVASMECHPTKKNLNVENVECIGNKIAGLSQEVAVTVSSGGEEINKQTFYLFASKDGQMKSRVALYDQQNGVKTGNTPLLADCSNIPMEEGIPGTGSMYFTPDAAGKWRLWIGLDSNGDNVFGPWEVDIKDAPTSASNLSVVSYEIDSKKNTLFKLKVKNNNSEGYYLPILCYLFENGKQYNIAFQESTNLNIVPGGTTELEFHFESLEPNKSYFLELKHYIDHQSGNLARLGNYYSFVVADDAVSEPYLTLLEDGTILTFYNDKYKDSRPGMIYSLDERDVNKKPLWCTNTTIKTVVFDPSFADARPTDTSNWFSNLSNLTDIQGMEYLNTSNTTNMAFMFYGCKELNYADVGSFKTSKVTNMKAMFYDCKKITQINLQGFNTKNVTDMSYMFEGCRCLENINLSSFNTSKVKTMECMFMDCKALKQLNIKNFNTSSVTTMRMMFNHCEGIEHLDLSSFRTSKVTDMYCMFVGCANLKSVNLSSFDTSNVETMEGMFWDCQKLVHLDLSHFNTKRLKTTYSMFYVCGSLETVDLRGFNTASLISTGFMFAGCTNLTTIRVGRLWTTGNVREDGCMFLNAVNLVGGQGTTYQSNHIDKSYARIDGGASCPGYFTGYAKACLGDFNGDDEVSVQDVMALVNIILGTDMAWGKAIDLGLPSGLKWASCNVGASSPEEIGGYYAWGETEEKDWFSWGNYAYCNGTQETCHDIGPNISGTAFDAAFVKWGGNWRMPTIEEINELESECEMVTTSMNGVKGILAIGPNGNSIFLPCGGLLDDDDLEIPLADDLAFYWSATGVEIMENLDEDDKERMKGCAYYLMLYTEDYWDDDYWDDDYWTDGGYGPYSHGHQVQEVQHVNRAIPAFLYPFELHRSIGLPIRPVESELDGDINNDEEVTVSDVMELVNLILYNSLSK